ncbi:MAG: chemotaxis protein CheW [Deltaproteobacteria bacterium]|nr:chemotaxis protein CheW [Deltaproteobacteria bacterium]
MTSFKVVVFRLGDRFAALEEKYSEEFFVLNHITRVPVAPPYMGNICNWQGNIIPVIDISPFFGEKARSVVTKLVAIAVNTSGKDNLFSLVTDGVEGVYELTDKTEEKNDLPFFSSNLLEFRGGDIYMISPFIIEKFITNHLKKII